MSSRAAALLQQLADFLTDGDSGSESPAEWNLDHAAARGAYYFYGRHGLIRRHVETIDLDVDLTGRHQLTVDLDLPRVPEARLIAGPESDTWWYLFPLAFLPKMVPQTGLDLVDEDGASLPLLTRAENSKLSERAILQAASAILGAERGGLTPTQGFRDLVHELVDTRPQRASSALAAIVRSRLYQQAARASDEHWAAFDGVLRLLMEHSILWTPLAGHPGQPRVVKLSYDFEVDAKPVIETRLERLDAPIRIAQLDVPAVTYRKCRRKRIDAVVLTERLGQTLAWMPIEFSHPTNFAKRAGTYHFQLRCPPGLRPRALRIGTPGDERPPENNPTDGWPHNRVSLGHRTAHLYVSRGPVDRDIELRLTFGIGTGVLPALWVLASSLTAALIWLFAFLDPAPDDSSLQIAAGILLVVPALLTGLVFGLDARSSITRLLGGARLLVLASALAAVGAAGVLIDAVPFGLERQEAWTVYAAIATVATVPLTVSWFLSKRIVWTVLEQLSSPRRHYIASGLMAGVAATGLLALGLADAGTVARALSAAGLLILATAAALVANDRTAVALDESRGIAPPLALLTCAVCAATATYEIARITDAVGTGNHELLGVWVLVLGAVAMIAWARFRHVWRDMRRERHARFLYASLTTAEELVAGERIETRTRTLR